MLENISVNFVKTALESIAGLWYSQNGKIVSYFGLIEIGEKYQGLLQIKENNHDPQKFPYRIVREGDKMFLEIDEEKFKIIHLPSEPKEIFSFRVNNYTILELRKL
jgi:hypothetical protein